MSIFGKLGLVNESQTDVNSDENENSKEIIPEKKQEIKKVIIPDVKKAKISFAPITSPASTGQIVGKIDNEISEKLYVAIEENNLDGNDFFEFMQSLNKMSNLAIDEKTKFNMVFSTLTTSSGGMTKEHLVDSIGHYINVIENEKNIFQKEMDGASTEMVENKEAHAEELSKSANEKAEQIKQLTQEIQEINEEISATNLEVSQSKISIAQKQADFDITVQQLQSQILDYKTKIEQHIQ